MSARIPVALAFFSLSILAGATNSQAAPSAVDRAHDVTLAQSPSERARSVSGVAPVLTAPAPMTLPGGTTADQVLSNVLTQLRPGAIVLMHENRGNTLNALPQLLQAIAQRGYQTVTVPELLTMDPPSKQQLKAHSCS